MPVLSADLNRFVRFFGGLVPHSYTSGHYTDLEAMKADYKATGRIKVNTEFGSGTVFGDPSAAWAFRAWHDMCHVITNAGFDLAGETRVCIEMQRQLNAHPDFKNLSIDERDKIMRIIYALNMVHIHYDCPVGPDHSHDFIAIYSEGLKVWPKFTYMPQEA